MLLETEFGAFCPAEGRETADWVEDSSVGLSIRTGAITDCQLLGVPENGELQFSLGLESDANISITKRSCDKEICPVLQRIKQTFGFDGTHLPCPWLDEWTDNYSPCKDCPFSCFETADEISGLNEISIQVETPDLRIHTCFKPTWTDWDHTVLRIFDSRNQRSLYIDLASPGVSFRSTEGKIGALHFQPYSPN